MRAAVWSSCSWLWRMTSATSGAPQCSFRAAAGSSHRSRSRTGHPCTFRRPKTTGSSQSFSLLLPYPSTFPVTYFKSAQSKNAVKRSSRVCANLQHFCLEPSSSGVTRGEQPLVRASRASKVAGAFLVLFWHAKENIPLSLPQPLHCTVRCSSQCAPCTAPPDARRRASPSSPQRRAGSAGRHRSPAA